jgi:hypothetical protein
MISPPHVFRGYYRRRLVALFGRDHAYDCRAVNGDDKQDWRISAGCGASAAPDAHAVASFA